MQLEARAARYVRKHRRLKPLVDADSTFSVLHSPLAVIVHPAHWRKPCTFRLEHVLSGLVTPVLAKKIATALGRYYVRFAAKTAASRHNALESFLSASRQFILPQDRPALHSLVGTETASRWVAAYEAHSDSIRSEPIKLTTVAEKFDCLHLTLSELAGCGLVPHLTKAELPKNYHATATRREGLIERGGDDSQQISASAIEKLKAHLQRLGIEFDSDAAAKHVQSLAKEIDLANLLSEQDYYEAILALNEKHLDELRHAAESDFMMWRDHYSAGQALLSKADPATLKLFDSGQLSPHSPMATFRRIFPFERPEIATANFLYLCVHRFNAQIPAETKVPDWRSRLLLILRNLGGKFHLDAMLSLHREGIACGIIIFLVDTGANVSTALELLTDREEKTDTEGLVRVISTKARSGYEPIVEALPVVDSAHRIGTVQILREIEAMTIRRRQLLPRALANHLFVFSYFSTPSVADSAHLGFQFNYLLKRHTLPQGWVPSAIRVAVAVREARESVGNLRNVQQRLKHKTDSPVTTGYAFSYPIRKLLEMRIRKFTDLLQAAFSSHVPGTLLVLGNTRGESRHLIAKAKRTGLGMLCANSKAGARPGTKAGQDCKMVGECPDCSQRMFVVDLASMTEVIAVNSILSERRQELEATAEQRWSAVYVELLAFTTVVISLVKRSPFAHLVPHAKARADQLRASGFDPTLLRP